MSVVMSAPLLIAYCLVLSGVLWAAIRLGWGNTTALVVALSVAAIPFGMVFWADGPADQRRIMMTIWAIAILVPTGAVWMASRLGAVVARPWTILIVGPVAFSATATIMVSLYNLGVSGR